MKKVKNALFRAHNLLIGGGVGLLTVMLLLISVNGSNFQTQVIGNDGNACPEIACPADCSSGCITDANNCPSGKCKDPQSGTPTTPATPAISRTQERRDLDNNIQNRQREVKDLTRELDRCKKEAPQVNYTLADSIVQKFETTIQELNNLLATQPVGSLYDEFDSWLFWDKNSSLDSRDFWDNINECNSMQQWKGWGENVKNRQRELKDIGKQFKDLEKSKVTIEGTEAYTLSQTCTGLVGQLDTLVQQKSVDLIDQASDLQRDIDTCFSDFWYSMQALQEQRQEVEQQTQNERQLKDIERVIKDKQRMIEKDMTRELERATKGGGNIEEAQKCINKLKGYLKEMQDALTAKDAEGAWDANSNIDYANQECWELINSGRQAEEFSRQRIPDREREVKDRLREVEKLSKEAEKSGVGGASEAVEQLQEIVTEMQKLIEKIKAKVAEGNYDEARELDDWNFQDLRSKWDELRPQVNWVFEVKMIKRDLEGGLKEIEQLNARLDASQGKRSESEISACKSFLNEQAKPLLKEGLAKLEAGNLEWLEENGREMQNLEFEGNKICGFIMDGRGGMGGPDIRAFVQEDFDGQNKDMMQTLIEKMSGEIQRQVMEKIMVMSTELIDNLMAKVSERFQEAAAKTLEAISFIPQEYQNEMLEKKASILERIGKVEGRLGNMADQIADYNFVGETAKKVEEKLAAVESGGKVSAAEIDALKAEAKNEKYELKVIPFRDTDDTDWFTRYVKPLSDQAIVAGYKDASGNALGEYRPGNKVKRVEIIKMVVELSGRTADGNPSKPQLRDGWYAPYVAASEDLTTTRLLNAPGEEATRGEVIQTMLEVAGVPIYPNDTQVFSDVSASNPYKAAIEQAYNMNIVSGYEDGTFKPDAPINRAEVAKLISKLIELMGNK